MTALPNMPTREEVEEALRICDASSIDGQFYKVEIFPLIAAARAYLMLKPELDRLQHKLNASEEHRAQLLKDPNTLAKEAWELIKADYVPRSELEAEKAKRVDAEQSVDFYKSSMVSIAKEFGIVSPIQLIAKSENDEETYADVLLKVIRETLLAAELQVGRLRLALEAACIGSCNCSTKTPDPKFHAELCPYKIYRTALASTPPTDVLERVRKMARTLDAIKAHQHLEIHSCPCAFMLDEALEQAKEMGLV